MNYTAYDIKDAIDLMEQDNFPDNYSSALDILMKIHLSLKETGKSSSFLDHHIAICLDVTGDSLKAASWIQKAISCDPFDITIERTAGIVFRNIELLIQKESRDNSNDNLSTITNLFQVLEKAGRVTSNAQFLMIRYYMKCENYHSAKYLLVNALERNPNDKDFLAMRKNIAEMEGDSDYLEVVKKTELSLLPISNFQGKAQ